MTGRRTIPLGDHSLILWGETNQNIASHHGDSTFSQQSDIESEDMQASPEKRRVMRGSSRNEVRKERFTPVPSSPDFFHSTAADLSSVVSRLNST